MITQHFKSAGEFYDFVESPTEMSRRDRTSQIQEPSRRWDNNTDWDASVRLAENGWPEGVALIEAFTSKLNTVLSGMVKLPEYHYDVDGDFVDYDKLLQGDPECVIRIVDSNIRVDATPPRIVRVVANICVSAALDASTLIMRGAALTALVTMLERHGTRCDIDIVAANRSGGGVETWIRVKHAEEALHLENLVFMLAHPAFFRRLVFSAWEHLPANVRRSVGISHGHGYGYVGDASDRGDIHMSGLESSWAYSEADTLKWITSQLEAQGIELVMA